jgi:hypothetical protein
MQLRTGIPHPRHSAHLYAGSYRDTGQKSKIKFFSCPSRVINQSSSSNFFGTNLSIKFLLPTSASYSDNDVSTALWSSLTTCLVYSTPPAALMSSSASLRISAESPISDLRCCRMLKRRLRCGPSCRRAWMSGREILPSPMSSAKPFW